MPKERRGGGGDRAVVAGDPLDREVVELALAEDRKLLSRTSGRREGSGQPRRSARSGSARSARQRGSRSAARSARPSSGRSRSLRAGRGRGRWRSSINSKRLRRGPATRRDLPAGDARLQPASVQDVKPAAFADCPRNERSPAHGPMSAQPYEFVSGAARDAFCVIRKASYPSRRRLTIGRRNAMMVRMSRAACFAVALAPTSAIADDYEVVDAAVVLAVDVSGSMDSRNSRCNAPGIWTLWRIRTSCASSRPAGTGRSRSADFEWAGHVREDGDGVVAGRAAAPRELQAFVRRESEALPIQTSSAPRSRRRSTTE